MKKIILLGIAVATFTFASAQTKSKDWNVGLHFGTQEYRGDIGDEFFSFDQHGAYGVSLSKYLTPWFDAMGMVTFSNLDAADSISSFEAQFLDFNVMAKMKFNNGKWLKESSFFQPYIFLGFGDAVSWADHYDNDRNMSVDVNLLGGVGINFAVSERIGVNLMSKYTYMWNDKIDDRTFSNETFQDQALMTTIGLNYNFTGAADSDGDGIKDKNDKCPTVFGLAKFDGCPDTDADGIVDSKDACPKVAGTLNGCPDTDGDGIADKDDACPTVAGTVTFNGCKDSDGDGIEDSKDACPTIPGVINGCPDTDGDGVEDSKDACPTVAGTVKGCPDTDKDGIIDSKDKCPKVAGVASNNGCPVIKEADEESKKVFNQAMEGLFFNSGSAVIKTESYSVLNNVVSILQSHPTYRLHIDGHTDNTGNASKNMSLSAARAAAAKAYLVGKGIDGSRLETEGFGITRPRADNSTAAGRKLNRRVEFKPIF